MKMKVLSILALVIVCYFHVANSNPIEKVHVEHRNPSVSHPFIDVSVKAFNREHNLQLQKPSSSIFSSNFKFLLADVDENGKTVFTDATPSAEDLSKLEKNIHIDTKSNAVVRVHGEGNQMKLTGVVDSFAIHHSDDVHYAIPHFEGEDLKLDYIDLKRNLTPSKTRESGTKAAGIAELFLVVDYKKSQETFGGNLNALADYLTVFFHAVNNRYATENDPRMSFLVSGAVAFVSRAGQEFIERAKIPGSNSYESGAVLEGLGDWLYANLATSPKHDLGVLITEEDMNGVGGLAWMNAACWISGTRELASSLNVDQGQAWRGVFVVAHEIGHNLGAPHDGDDGDGRDCPGEDGYLMGDTARPNHNKYYMSQCTKRTINRFLDTENSACLRSYQADGHWDLGRDDPGHRMDMTGQCKIWTGISNSEVVPDRDPNELCKNLICWWPDESGDFMWVQTMNLPPGDNSPCGNGGRCWLGNCV